MSISPPSLAIQAVMQVNAPVKKEPEASVDSYSRFAQKWQSLMHGGKNLAHTYVEKPAMFSMLPEDLQGKEVLCLGCGTGEECQYGSLIRGVDTDSFVVTESSVLRMNICAEKSAHPNLRNVGSKCKKATTFRYEL
jgi:hypothetical protein